MIETRPAFKDILEARDVIRRFLPRTPLFTYPQLDSLVGTEVYVKHENHTPTGAFKVRGGINLVAHMTEEQKRRGVVTASTGNHALSVAYASRLFSVPVTIVMPEKSNPVKVSAIENQGARIVFHGRIFDESRVFAEDLARKDGKRFIHPANEPYLIAGVGTYALEAFEECPSLDVIIVPVGGGSGACGCCLVKEAVNSKAQVIGVQAEKAPAAYHSWKSGSIQEDRMETVAEGLATMTGYELTQEILRDLLSDFVLVSEDGMAAAVKLYLETIRNLAEESGAAPLAAALKLKNELRGKIVCLVLSGGNLAPERLKAILG